MGRTLRWRILLVLVIVGVCLWQLNYSLRLYRLSPEDRSQIPEEELDKLHRRSIHLGLDLRGGMHLILEVDKSKLTEEEAKGATDRALEILRNRIDQFGVTEPSIEKQGRDRVVIQLPGIADRERAKRLIGKTAQLEFRLVEEAERTHQILQRIDKSLGEAEGDTMLRPLLSSVEYLGVDFVVVEEKVPAVRKMLGSSEAGLLIPPDEEFSWGKRKESAGYTYLPLLLVKKEASLTGAAIVDARPGPGGDPGEVKVDLTMTRRARGRWAQITGANVGRRIAIVLDGVIQSAPVVRERIATGASQITMGGARMEEARDLAIVLKAGALPAPVKIAEERSVGPSLGADSIRKGVRSIMIGGIGILLFMVIYYSLSGMVANLALVLNLIILLAVLSGFRATLTLPGIAGIVLTIGAAVDANVLIFERIREELKSGKAIRLAISTGYERAFRTILDANLTTFLTAIILYWFGTGPVKGFAVTLSIGIAASFFTAIVVTRLIFDLATTRLGVKRLRI